MTSFLENLELNKTIIFSQDLPVYKGEKDNPD